MQRIYEPCSRELISPDEKRLLTPYGHSSHVNEQFVDYCEPRNVAFFCLPRHSTHLLLPLQIGHFGPLQHYEIGLDECFRDHGENFGPTPFQFVLKRVGKPIAWLTLSVPYALLALYSLTLAPSSNLEPNLKLKENSNQSRTHHTLSASYTSKRMLPLHLLRQRHWGRLATSFFASLMLLNRASSRYGGNCKC